MTEAPVVLLGNLRHADAHLAVWDKVIAEKNKRMAGRLRRLRHTVLHGQGREDCPDR